MSKLDGQVAVVTGGTLGVAGRSARGPWDDPSGTLIRCDHRIDAEVAAAFEHIAVEAGRIDILVNNVWDGYEGMVGNAAFIADPAVLRHSGSIPAIDGRTPRPPGLSDV